MGHFHTALIAAAFTPLIGSASETKDTPAHDTLATLLAGHFDNNNQATTEGALQTHTQGQIFKNNYLSEYFGGGKLLLIRQYANNESTRNNKARIYHLKEVEKGIVKATIYGLKNPKIAQLAAEGRTSAVEALMGLTFPPLDPRDSQKLQQWHNDIDIQVEEFISKNNTNTPTTLVPMSHKKADYFGKFLKFLNTLEDKEDKVQALLEFSKTLRYEDASLSLETLYKLKSRFVKVVDDFKSSLPNGPIQMKAFMEAVSPTFEEAFQGIKAKHTFNSQVIALISLQNDPSVFSAENKDTLEGELYPYYENKWKKVLAQTTEEAQLQMFINVLTSPNDNMNPDDPLSDSYFSRFMALKAQDYTTEKPFDFTNSNVPSPKDVGEKLVNEQMSELAGCQLTFEQVGNSWVGSTNPSTCIQQHNNQVVSLNQTITVNSQSLTIEDSLITTQEGPKASPEKNIVKMDRTAVYDCWIDRGLGTDDTQKGVIIKMTGGSQKLGKWETDTSTFELRLQTGAISTIELLEHSKENRSLILHVQKEVSRPLSTNGTSSLANRSNNTLGNGARHSEHPNLVAIMKSRGVRIPEAPAPYSTWIGFKENGYQGACRYAD